MEKIYGFVEIAIPAGRTQQFIDGARACHEAALADLTGTHVYDWFLSDDGHSAYVLEVYDDPAALAHHSQVMAGRVDRLIALADFRILFAGLVPEALQARMRQRIGAVDWFGRRVHGLMTEPSPHRVPDGEPIFALAWFTPRAGQAEALHALAAESFARARDMDPGTLGYEWFVDDRGQVLAMDIYADAAAMAAHMQNCGPIMARILQSADSRTLLFGDVPETVRGRLKPELGVRVFGRRLHGVS